MGQLLVRAGLPDDHGALSGLPQVAERVSEPGQRLTLVLQRRGHLLERPVAGGVAALEVADHLALLILKTTAEGRAALSEGSGE